MPSSTAYNSNGGGDDGKQDDVFLSSGGAYDRDEVPRKESDLSDLRIIVGADSGVLFAYDLEGRVKWAAATHPSANGIHGTACVITPPLRSPEEEAAELGGGGASGLSENKDGQKSQQPERQQRQQQQQREQQRERQ